MSEPQHNTPGDSDLQAPQELISGIEALYAAKTAVPPAVDEAILGAARRQMVHRRRVRLTLRWAIPSAAAAAIVLLIFLLNSRTATEPAAQTQITAAQDIDGNGLVDILDALALASRIKEGRITDQRWDFNGDGLIDREDVDTVAMSAVQLDKGTL